MESVGVAVVESGDCFAVGRGEDVGGVGVGEVWEVFGEDGDSSRDWMGEAAGGLC